MCVFAAAVFLMLYVFISFFVHFIFFVPRSFGFSSLLSASLRFWSGSDSPCFGASASAVAAGMYIFILFVARFLYLRVCLLCISPSAATAI